ncbi:MAG: hypothetical protein AAF962_11930 [Actinomycetota bacterium]
MPGAVRPTLQAIVNQAVAATGASSGWLLAVGADDLEVVATAGGTHAEHIGRRFAATGAQGYVLSSGQAAALLPQPDDPANVGAGGFDGVPPSVVAVPCGEDAVGVLELVDKADGLPFTFADIEAVSGLAAVAAAAMTEQSGGVPNAPASPAELAADLRHLAERDPARYADTARLVQALLGR